MSMHNRSKQGFTLVEILIVVVILGILAAIVIPQFTNASESARASSLTSQLQTVRSQIELYQVQHNGNYPDLKTNGWDQMTKKTDADGTFNTSGSFGAYLQQAPTNAFQSSATVVQGASALGSATSTSGWVYNKTTGEIKAVVPFATAHSTGLVDSSASDFTDNPDFVDAPAAS